MPSQQGLIRTTLIVALLIGSATAAAQEANIRKTLAERMPQLPQIDAVTRTPMPGVWEVRYGGTDILYSDDKGDHVLVGGALTDTKTGTDLTQLRRDKLLAIAFDTLPLKDAVVIRQGTGARRLAVFADPNCGYCKHFERDLLQVRDVTIYTFVLPILGPDSTAKSRNIWCARDAAQAWRNWMLNNTPPPKSAAGCDAKAIDRNLAFAQAHRINGTPAVLFEDGTRKPGAMAAGQVQALLAAAAGRR